MSILRDAASLPPDSSADPEELPLTKRCTKCPGEIYKPLSEFYVKDKMTGRLFSWCKACHAGMTKISPEKAREYHERRKAADPEGYKAKRTEAMRQYRETEQGKVGSRAAARAWRQANPEKVKAKKKAYKARRQHVVNAWNRKKYAADPAAVLARKKAWAEANPEKWAVICARAKHRRRDREAVAACTLTGEEWAEILRLAGNACVRCRRPFGPRCKPYKDHIVPLSKGGGLTASNVQSLCLKCNNEKYVDDTDYRGLLPGFLD